MRLLWLGREHLHVVGPNLGVILPPPLLVIIRSIVYASFHIELVAADHKIGGRAT